MKEIQMEIQDFIATLEKSNFILTFENDKLVLKGKTQNLDKVELQALKGNEFIINYIKENKNELIKYLSLLPQQSISSKKSKDVISIYRLSPLQEGILFHGLYNEQSGLYIEQFSCDLSGLSISAFQKSWEYIIEHHSVLRSAFFYNEFKVPVQCVYRKASLPIKIVDYSKKSEEEQNILFQQYRETDRKKGFDIKSVPLMRITLFQLSQDRFRMLWTWHHILFDGWSLPILMEEFLTCYNSLISGREVTINQEDLYEDFIRHLERKNKEQEEKYWRQYMEGVTQSTLLPFIDSAVERSKGGGVYQSISLKLNVDTSSAIQNYAQRNHVTINTIMQGVWCYLLHRYTGTSDVMYGVVVSGRPEDLPDVEKRVGMYINTLPLRSVLKEGQHTTEWLKILQEQQILSRQFQNTSLIDIQRWTGIHKELFDTLFVFENYPINKVLSSTKWPIQIENIHTIEQTNYPLTIIIGGTNEISVSFQFNSTILPKLYVDNICSHFNQVIQQIINNEADVVGDLRLLSPAEERQLLVNFNDTAVAYPKEQTLVSLLEEQVIKTPHNIAVVFEDRQLTYQQLHARANQLAHYLRRRGVREDVLVPICLERSLEMIVAIVGVLKAGGAYVPMDPEYPRERLHYMLQDTGATLVLSSSKNKSRLPEAAGVEILELDRVDISQEPAAAPATNLQPHHLAYVIYTSGSTGTPKGVMIEHRSVHSFICWCQEEFSKSAFEVVYATTSICFDLSVYEMFYPLSVGKPIRVLQNGLHISRYLTTDAAVLINSVPVVVEQLIREGVDLGSVSIINMAGEPIPLHVQQGLDTGRIEVRNLYGPTEDTTYSTVFRLQQGKPVWIGRPISNTQIHILSSKQQLCPVGVAGELCIGGAGLARGYLNRLELTQEKFIPDPFSKAEGARLYRTGDLARWLPDGNLEYLGRIDDQVKIRGYRIELGEVEAAVQGSGLVKQCVVVAKEDAQGAKHLVGYVVVEEGSLDREALVGYLHRKLPEYMVPQLWMTLEALPLTPNGKVDRKRLPQVDSTAMSTKDYVAPQGEVEEKLAAIWQELLQVEKVGLHDNFFELGGHSLLVMRVISAIRKELAVELEIKDLFSYPTVALLAERLQTTAVEAQKKASILPPIEVIYPRPARLPLSFSQERLWFINKLEDSVQYHIPAVLRLKGILNIEALAHALRTIVNRHEVLRTTFLEEEGIPYQLIKDKDQWQLSVLDRTSYSEDQQKLQEQIQQIIQQPLDLSKDDLLRANLITLSESEHILVIILHHIASDGWSTSILVKEIIEIYNAYEERRLPKLKELPIQYADYTLWQRQYLQGEVLERKLSYWKEKLKGVTPLQLPTDFVRPAVQSTKGALKKLGFNNKLLHDLKQLTHQQGTTLYMTLLSAFKVLLYRYSGQSDICVGSPIAGRQQQELESLIGFFVNTLALRSEVKGEESFKELLQQVKQTTLEAYDHQEVPFEKVVDVVVKERDQSRTPIFQVMFVLQNTPEVQKLELGKVELLKESHQHTTTLFDLTFFITETAQGLEVVVEYATALYRADTIERMLQHFEQLLCSIVSAPDSRVEDLRLLSAPEERQLLEEFNNTKAEYPKDQTIVSLFEQQVQKTPDAVAVIFEDQQLSYRQLNERANQLAHYLRSKGIREETLVSICIERSLEMLIGIMGILKAGGAYVPIDPEYPKERIEYMLQDCGAALVVSSSRSNEKLPATKGLEVLQIDAIDISTEAKSNPEVNLKPQHLAYVIYTSGSTGKPKGVMIEHKSVVNLIVSISNEVDFASSSRFLSVTTYSFDICYLEFYLPLITGSKLFIVSRAVAMDGYKLSERLEQYCPTHMQGTPATWQLLLDSGWNNKEAIKILIGGEAVREALKEDLTSRASVWNVYGPTETTIWSTIKKLQAGAPVLIGRPISNTCIYIVSKAGQLCPVGVPGELCIAGDGLARGYLNKPELTQEKFIPNPFSQEEGARLYRTGDLCRWLPDGNLEYLGRMDDQVKIRGYRIEQGEVEAVVQQSGLVKQCVVVAKPDSSGTKHLVGYVVVGEERSFNREELIAYLHQRLPEYMVPQLWMQLEQLPLTSNGKINKKALPELNASEQSSKEYIAPRTELEQKLAAIWQELLNVQRVGIHDNFFELGGHSLLAMRVISYIEKRLLISIPVKAIFKLNTISDLSKYIETQASTYNKNKSAVYTTIDI